jgi:sensor histidine kinase YesM
MIKDIFIRYKQVLIHAGFLLFILGTPVFFNDIFERNRWAGIFRTWIPVLSFILVFYINYFLLIDKYFFQKKYIPFIVINVLIFAAIIFTMHLTHEYVWKNFELNIDRNRPRPSAVFIFYSQFFSLFTSAIVSIAVKSVQKNNRIEKEKKEIEKAHLESELNQLKQQLNPHFLFNTLNNIYSLIAINQSKAQESVHMLSHMMRYVLYESEADFLPVSKEIAFIKNYINLMKLRLTSHTKLDINIDECPGEYLIAPLVLITFAENAFKHSAGAAKDTFINISIRFDENRLIYSVTNNIGNEQKLNDKNSGVGLANLSKRLSLLYGKDYYLFTSRKDNIFYADLEIKLRK